MGKKLQRQLAVGLEGTTSLSVEDVLAIASKEGDGLSASGNKLVHAGQPNDVLMLELQQATLGSAIASKLGANNGRRGLMRVTVTSEGGKTRLKATVDPGRFMTHRTTYMMVPLTPKSLVGFQVYRRFVANLAKAIQSRDPGASLSSTPA